MTAVLYISILFTELNTTANVKVHSLFIIVYISVLMIYLVTDPFNS